MISTNPLAESKKTPFDAWLLTLTVYRDRNQQDIRWQYNSILTCFSCPCTYIKQWSKERLTRQYFSRTIPNDDVCRLLFFSVEIVFKNALCTGSVTCLEFTFGWVNATCINAKTNTYLGIEGSTRIMRSHAVSSTKRVLHGTPRVISRRWLNIPYIAYKNHGLRKRSKAWYYPQDTHRHNREADQTVMPSQ